MAKTKNTTRQTIERDPRNPEPHIDSGYEGDGPSNEFTIPSCGIEDADTALFRLFDKDIGFTTKDVNSSKAANKTIAIKKPFVIFATGERFALAKRLKPPRDKNKTLMLPAISVRRTSFSQDSADINGRGINQFTGNLTIKRRLAAEDKDYQNVINKLALQNMSLPATTTRDTGDLEKDIEIYHGGLLTPKLNDNLYEIITIPQPQFFTTTYEVVFWTSYIQHMNYMIETFVSSFLPHSREHRLNTDKGYWFMAYTDDSLSSQENFDNFSDNERVIRYSFNITVKGFILAPSHETNQVSIRRWVSSPIITFDAFPAEGMKSASGIEKQDNLQDKDKFVLSDINQDPKKAQNPTTNQKFVLEKTVIDPKSGKAVRKTVRVRERNQKKGETVYMASDKEALKDFIDNINFK